MIVRNPTLPTPTRKLSRAAFTLLEMLLVVAIIAVVAGIGIFALLPQGDRAKADLARTRTKELTQAVKAYHINHHVYPDSLQQLLVRDEKGGPYIEDADALYDPWDQPYIYEKAGSKNNGARPDIYTTNPGTGELIGNWAKAR
jgi:prepilin-type N-terminal cleavage/methylation domain-containing protein